MATSLCQCDGLLVAHRHLPGGHLHLAHLFPLYERAAEFQPAVSDAYQGVGVQLLGNRLCRLAPGATRDVGGKHCAMGPRLLNGERPAALRLAILGIGQLGPGVSDPAYEAHKIQHPQAPFLSCSTRSTRIPPHNPQMSWSPSRTN